MIFSNGNSLINPSGGNPDELITDDVVHHLRKNTFTSFTLLAILLFGLSLSLVFHLLESNLFHQDQALYGGLTWISGQLFLLFLLKQGFSKNLIVNMSMTLSAVIINATAWSSAGIVAIETPLLLLLPLIALSVQGQKAGMLWSLVIAIDVFAMALAPMFGANFSKPSLNIPWTVASSIFLLLVMLCSYCLIQILQRQNKKLQEELADLISYHRFKGAHDGLTQFLNKESFKASLQRKLDRLEHESSAATLLVVDLNKFKRVNDKYGHLVGDQVLKGVAENLRLGLRAEDIAGRIGGDEFAILLEGVTRQAEIDSRVRSLNYAIRQPIPTKAGEISVDAAIGASVFSIDGKNFDELYDAADASMYQSKRQEKVVVID